MIANQPTPKKDNRFISSAAGRNLFPFIFLYGPPATGKSTIAPKLAGLLGMSWLDLDELIEQRDGRTIQNIFQQSGEVFFRQLESEVLQELLADSPKVVALGGGTLLSLQNRQAVEVCGRVVCLTAPVEVLISRIQAAKNARPLLEDVGGDGGNACDHLVDLLNLRQDHYDSFAMHQDTSLGSPARIALELQTRMGYFYLHHKGKNIRKGYPILLQRGGLAALGEYLTVLELHGPVALVADANVAEVYGAAVLQALKVSGYKAALLTFPPGERHKTLETVVDLYQGFAAMGLERDSTVVALGGGITSDMAGFAASTYLRGIRWVAVPTSVLAMADASIGGKTGYNLAQGKNLVGTFHPPSLVLADPQTLATLPHRELVAGLAEIVKAGLISDPYLFKLCASGFGVISEHLDEVIQRSMGVKLSIVQADPFEHHGRAALNLGHTLGHAIERASEYRLLHGEAVSIGLVLEARLSERQGLADRGLSNSIAACLAGLGLPIELPARLSSQAIIRAALVDKKCIQGSLRFVLPTRPGKVRIGVSIMDWQHILSV